MDPEYRRQVLQALAKVHASLPDGVKPTAKGDDDAIRQITNGQMKGMADLIPSTPDVTGDVGVPMGAGLLNAPGDFGRGVMKAPGAVAHALAHPVQTGGAMQDMFFNSLFSPQQGTDVSGRSVGARGGVPIRSGGGMVTADTPGSITPATAEQAQRNLVGGSLMGLGPLGAMAGGVLANPSNPAEGAGQMLGTYGTGAGMAKAGGVALDAASQLASKARFLPEAAAAGALAKTTIPASGGVAGIQQAMETFGPEVSGANPMLAEYSRAGMEGLQEAAAKSPELWAYLKDVMEKRGKTQSIADAIEQKRNAEVGPKLDAFKAEDTPFQTGGTGYHVQDAMKVPAAAQAMREAVRNGWMPKTPNDLIPGTGDGNWVASDPYILAAAKKLPKGGVPPGRPNPDLAAGQPMTHGQAFAIRKILDDELGHASTVENFDALKATRDRLDAELRTQSPTYADLMQQWAKPSQLADQYRATVGELKLPQSPAALGGHQPLGMNPQSLVSRPAVFSFLDQFRRAKAQSAGAMLSARASGTPVTINDVLQALGGNK